MILRQIIWKVLDFPQDRREIKNKGRYKICFPRKECEKFEKKHQTREILRH